ncbi:MAG: serine/threonine-protein kinase [Acidobacteriota bacterium]|nr:serine/threonine-protein kinase [Acidobacteriota bacterium]
MIGRTLSHYEIVGELGAGGMGVVYRAHDTLLQRAVALKVLPADAMADESRQRRFLQEARAASALNHPHIVTIYDVIHEDGVYAIVMELIEGTSLQALVERGPVPVQQALAIARQIADALGVAHAAGIVHRDLKPANVIVTARGQAKVLDFGIAKLDPMHGPGTDSNTRTALTMMGAVLGTAAYMSPEQARGDPVDARTDVFSLGVVIYEMLSGRSPFAGPTLTAVLHKLLYEQPPDLMSLPGLEVPPAVAATVERALAKNQGERYQSMDGVAAALDAISAGRSAPAHSSAISAVPQSQPRRRPLLIPAFAVLSVIIAGALLVGGWKSGWWRSPQTADPAASSVLAELPTTPFEAWKMGQAHLERYDRDGYIDRSIQAFQRAVDLKNDYAAAFAGLGLAYWRKYREQRDPSWLEKAEPNARRAVELEPQLTIGTVALASVNIERGQLEAAERALADALLRDPESADLLGVRAYLRLRQRDFAAAVADVQKAAALRPGDWSLPLLEGVILMTAGKHASAVPALERASQLAPDSALTFRNLGAGYHAVGRYGDATRSFQRALEIKADPSVYSNLGTAYFFQGLYGDAVAAFEEARKRRPNDFRAWANLADAYRFIPARKAEAVEAYTRGLQLLDQQITSAPGDIDLLTRRVVMLSKRGDCDGSRAASRAVAATSASSPAALYRLGVAHEVCDRRDDAVVNILKALEGGYSADEVARDPELVKFREDLRYHKFLSTISRPSRE